MNGFHRRGRGISAHEIARTSGKNSANSTDGKITRAQGNTSRGHPRTRKGPAGETRSPAAAGSRGALRTLGSQRTSLTASPVPAPSSSSPAPPISPRICATYPRVSAYGGTQPQALTGAGPAL